MKDLWGPDIRFDAAKLNMKCAGFGAPVEWHQDWAFYPHTNDDLAAVGVMFDDMAMENGPLMIIPGSHRGPIHDHHANGIFCGAMDPDNRDVDYRTAVPLLGKAGSITVHHVRAVHGSAPNVSDRDRRLLLFQFRTADAWPLLGFPGGIEKFNSLMAAGESREPRLEHLPVRLPLPPATKQGSLYENQKGMKSRFFATPDTAHAPEMAK
jgi:phytanoyl-CoA hydroxylase